MIVEQALHDWFVADTGIAAALAPAAPSSRVAFALPANAAPDQSWLIITRVGGPPVYPWWIERALIQVDAWATDRPTAAALEVAAEKSLQRLEGHAIAGAVVTAVEFVAGRTWLPDTIRTPPSPRFMFRAALTAHPSA